ncbi:MAG: AAA family ATPase [Candidatus Micrarchaeota archaeon]
MLWTSKYAPKNMSELCGNSESFSRMKKWALSFSLGKEQRPLLLWGPSGSAKTASASALASEMGLELIAFGPPSKEDIDKWEKRLGESIFGSSLFAGSTIIVCEDADKWHLSKVRGLMQKLAAKLKEAKIPVIITAQDAYDPHLLPIRPYCELLHLKAINHPDIMGALAKIAQEQNLNLQKEQLQSIALNSKGDLRAAINDLQALNFKAARESQKQQLEILRSVFRSPSYRAAKQADLGALSERSSLKLYAAENIPAELFDSNDMREGFNFLSRADVFDGRIRTRQYWGYLRYSSLLLLWGISSCRTHVKAGFTPYAFPSYIRKMGATRSKRATQKNSGAKIAPKCHCTTKRAAVYFPLICQQIESSKNSQTAEEKLCAYYKFSREDLASLCGVSVSNLGNGKPSRQKKS